MTDKDYIRSNLLEDRDGLEQQKIDIVSEIRGRQKQIIMIDGAILYINQTLEKLAPKGDDKPKGGK